LCRPKQCVLGARHDAEQKGFLRNGTALVTFVIAMGLLIPADRLPQAIEQKATDVLERERK
jgi:hypothetical protein